MSSTPASNQVLVLRNGDRPPLTPGFSGQASAKDYLKPYLTTDGHVVLPHPDNDVLYLFEMGGTDTSRTSFDRNDLIVLISGTDATN